MYHFSIALDEKNSETYGITNWEVTDGYFGMLLSEMSADQVEDVRDMLIRKLSRIVLYTVAMPVADFEGYVRFFRNAHLIGVEHIKLAYAAIENAAEEDIRQVLAVAESFSIKVLFELEAASIEKFDLEQYAKLRSENTGLILNPIEYAKRRLATYSQIYKMKLKDDIVILRVCDMVFDSLVPVLPGKGNGEIKECASNLLARSFGGYFAFSAYGDDVPVGSVIGVFAEMLCEM